MPVALLAHGAGSCAGTVVRLLGAAAPPDVRVEAVDGRGSVDEVVRRIGAAAPPSGLRLVGGISLGAHAAALWAARTGATCELVLAMPAWTGPPGAVAGLTAATASDVESRGIASVLVGVEVSATQGDWVVEELRRGWATYDDQALASALRAAATSPGPTLDELSRITARTVVVALADDPLHPLDVAERWAAQIPTAALVVVPRDLPARDRGALGRAARRALDATR